MRNVIRLSWMLAGLSLCCGLWYTLYQAWVCDDAFISYRYAQHFADGLGLVYNVGERVEGYSNFLWVVLLAVGMRFGFEPILFSQYLGVVFYVATLGLLWWTAVRSHSVPLAAIGLALHGHVALFATCGLETSMFTFFVTAGLVVLVLGSLPRHFAVAGLALILATMTRPDGAVFYACAGGIVLVLARRLQRWRLLLSFAAPFLLVYLPYFVWKWSYYGYPLPNTFYAKSASQPFVDQGSESFAKVARRIVPGGQLLLCRPLTGGVSASVHRLEIEGPDGRICCVVVRGPGDQDRTPPAGSAAATEFALLEALRRQGVTVPAPCLLDESREDLPTPYLAMEFVDGTTSVTATALPEALRQMAEFLARLHSLDIHRVELPVLPDLEDLGR